MIEYTRFESYEGEPNKERLKAAIKREPIDRIPNLDNLIEEKHVEKILGKYAGNTLSYGGDPAKGADAEQGRPMYPDDFIDLCKTIGQDVIKFNAGMWTPFKKYNEDGCLVQVSDKSIKSRKDFKSIIFDSKNQIENSVRYAQEYKQAVKKRKTKIGVMASYGCIMQTLYEFVVGMNDFMMMTYEEPVLIEEMLEISAEHFRNMTIALMKENVDFIGIADDVAFKTGLFIPPKIMKKIWLPRIAKIIEPAVKNDIPIMFHSDGKIDDIIEGLIEIGVDCINPMDPSGIDYKDYKRRSL